MTTGLIESQMADAIRAAVDPTFEPAEPAARPRSPF